LLLCKDRPALLLLRCCCPSPAVLRLQHTTLVPLKGIQGAVINIEKMMLADMEAGVGFEGGLVLACETKEPFLLVQQQLAEMNLQRFSSIQVSFIGGWLLKAWAGLEEPPLADLQQAMQQVLADKPQAGGVEQNKAIIAHQVGTWLVGSGCTYLHV
jgi:hypothetical protein